MMSFFLKTVSFFSTKTLLLALIMFTFTPSFLYAQCTNNLNVFNINAGSFLLTAIPNIINNDFFKRDFSLTVTCDESTPIMVSFISGLPSGESNVFSVVRSPQGKQALKVILELSPSATGDNAGYQLAPIGDVSLSSVTSSSSYIPVSGIQQIPSNAADKRSVWTLVDVNNGNQIVSAKKFSFPMTLKLITASDNEWRNELTSTGRNLPIHVNAQFRLSRL